MPWTKDGKRIERDRLADELAAMHAEIQAMRLAREAETKIADRSADLRRLKEHVADLEIQKSKREEGFAREKRETEHHVGLLRKKQDFEVESAKRDTELTIREGNLNAERERFERDMKFQRTELRGQVDYLRDIAGQLLGAVPRVNLTGSIAPTQNGNGDADAD